MLVEVDNGTENPVVLFSKAARYREFFRRTVKAPSSSSNPYARPAAPVEVVAPVGIQVPRLGARPSSQPPDRQDRVEQRQQWGDVAAVPPVSVTASGVPCR